MTLDARIKNYDPDRMILIPDFEIPQLNRQRLIRIYLPIDYHSSNKHYPVIYMHDGQNVFEPALCISGMSWQAGEHLDQIQTQGQTGGIILVTVDNSPLHNGLGRMNEYSPWHYNPIPELSGWSDIKQSMGGEGEAYSAFIADTLKPFIDQHYRTRPEREYTTVAGSSMGGLISLYIALRYQAIFGNAGVFSPAFWFAEARMCDFLNQTAISYPLNIYMDIGTAETSDQSITSFPSLYLEGAKRLHRQLQSKSTQINCSLLIDNKAVHSESAWARRYPEMVLQFYGANAS
ncbi:alpha/beta hydrolase [Photobacterium sp. SDRW27]|uniref:alpha/beta hydrolase n=1 Tax=Photobacterium obscurum TaxID=2829490 RepID=UPI002244CB87|nr:alpha/beta hydrolase-fold protein [Photobacterium obscurum]MCW8328641.1 alpha/beta hydrolase [Photobacterium obscurum]